MTRRLLDSDPRREQRRQERLLDRMDGQFSKAMAKEIARASRDMLDLYEAAGEVGTARDHYERVEQEFQRMVANAALTFGGRIIEQGKAHGLILERKEDFAQMMLRMALSYVGREAVRRKITSITETTRERIVSLVDQGYQEGLGVSAIAKNIRERIPGMSQTRGALIARTETHGAANFGADVAAKSTGLKLRKEWVASGGERTRPSHRRADGQIVGMDETFTVGGARLEYPGDPSGPADEVINCFAPWSLIRAAGLKAAMKREYIGDLIELSFGGPVNLTVTPNHPVLTNRGWMPARLVVKGDYVLYAGIGNVGEISPGPDIADRCARADDLYNAAQGSGSVVRPRGVIVNLHGEVPSHDVDIVSFEGELRDAFNASGVKLFGDISLADAHIAKGCLLFDRMAGLRDGVAPDQSDCLVGIGSPRAPLFSRGKRGGASVAFGDAGQIKASFLNASPDHCATDAHCLGDTVDGMTGIEHVDDIPAQAVPDFFPPNAWAPFEVRKITSAKSFHYSGPVYNFESDTGLLCSGGVVNHNCRCSISHLVED